MGVYIDMEMPKSCAKCKLLGEYGCPFIGPVGYAYTEGRRNERCPLSPVPPHVRLIDADELFKEMERKGWFDNSDRDTAEDLVLAAPTIIPAEEV